jgi:H+/Cl- antiporter ClcA
MPANSEPLHEASDSHSYYYRRSLKAHEVLPVLVVGVGAGLLAMYVARVLIQRTPLLPEASRRAVMRRAPRAIGDAG